MTIDTRRQKSNRFVAHFDMLGMSNLALHDSNLAYEALSLLRDAKEQRLAMEFELLDQKKIIRDRIDHFGFSDSVIILSRADAPEDAYSMGVLCTEFFYKAISSGVPLRGAITHGEIIHDPERDLLVGAALVNAVGLGEEAQWLGIVLDEGTAEALLSLPLESPRNRPICTKYEIPLKDGRRTAWIADWIEAHYEGIEGGSWDVEKFYSGFSKFGGPYAELAASARLKYQNTVDFINQPRM